MRMRMICTDNSLVEGPGYLAAGESYQVGRSSRCAFIVSDLSVSRFHAEVIVTAECVRVKDLKSRNGTFVDGKRVQELEVQPGQSVRFGNARFHLLADEQEKAPDENLSGLSTHFVPSKTNAHPERSKGLSVAQSRVLELLLMGLQEKEVATKLEVSLHTVHNHVKQIYKKLGVSSRAELLALFIVEGSKQTDSNG